MPTNGSSPDHTGPRFRTTLIRVLIVQAVTVALLGLMQLIYNI